MSKRLATINILWCLGDVIMCVVAILAFTGTANHFERWWIALLNIVPLLLFGQHSLIIDADLEAAKEAKGDERQTV